MSRLVQTWTGARADSLRQAMRMTNESFAEHLGVSVRAVAYWRNRPDMIPSQAMQEILDTALERAPERAKDHYWALQGASGSPLDSAGVVGRLLRSEDPASLTDWLTATSVSDEAVTGLDQATARLAESHGQGAPVVVLAEARQVQASAQGLLRAGRIRHRQATELLRINGSLLAHISLLLSDLGDDRQGEEYGNASLAYLREAGASEAPAWYVLAKIDRWRHQYARAADLARAGLDRSGRDPMRIELACYEANAAALAGDINRALSAMQLADETATSLPPCRMTLSPWSFPDERMTIFRISVALHTGDPDRARAHTTTSATLSPRACKNRSAASPARPSPSQGGNATMSPMPAEFTDQWRDRAEPAPGEGLVYWHMPSGNTPRSEPWHSTPASGSPRSVTCT